MDFIRLLPTDNDCEEACEDVYIDGMYRGDYSLTLIYPGLDLDLTVYEEQYIALFLTVDKGDGHSMLAYSQNAATALYKMLTKLDLNIVRAYLRAEELGLLTALKSN